MAALGLHTDSGNERLEFGEHDFKPRAATEGRPYSTFRETQPFLVLSCGGCGIRAARETDVAVNSLRRNSSAAIAYAR